MPSSSHLTWVSFLSSPGLSSFRQLPFASLASLDISEVLMVT